MSPGQPGPSLSEREAMRHLIERIKAKRLARNWSQSEFAKRTGVSRATIANLEGGYANLSLLNLVKILSVLGFLPNLVNLVPSEEACSTWDTSIAEPVRRQRASSRRKPSKSPDEA